MKICIVIAQHDNCLQSLFSRIMRACLILHSFNPKREEKQNGSGKQAGFFSTLGQAAPQFKRRNTMLDTLNLADDSNAAVAQEPVIRRKNQCNCVPLTSTCAKRFSKTTRDDMRCPRFFDGVCDAKEPRLRQAHLGTVPRTEVFVRVRDLVDQKRAEKRAAA